MSLIRMTGALILITTCASAQHVPPVHPTAFCAQMRFWDGWESSGLSRCPRERQMWYAGRHEPPRGWRRGRRWRGRDR